MKRKLLTCLSILSISTLIFAQTTFEPKSTINATTGASPYVIDSGLLNNDAFADIVIGTYYGNTIEWYTYNSASPGTFITETSLTTTLVNIAGVKIADLNADGFNDILASAYTNDKLVWFANNGTGGFGPEQEISSSILGAGTIATGYIDAGTTLDIAVVAYDSGDTVWFSNDGTGVFTGPNTIANVPGSGPGDIDLADFDGDGDLDVAIANTGNGGIELYDNNLIGSGTVSFTKYTNSLSTGDGSLFDVDFADVNDDGILDIIKSDIGGAGSVAYYTNDASGIATTWTETNLVTSITRPATATVADLDNDSKNDVIITRSNISGSDVVWLESTDVGTFNTEVEIDNSQGNVYGATTNDFDNDGDIDIATIDYANNDLNYFENNLFTLGIEENTINEITMYPNPVKNKLNFKGNFTNDLNVSVYNVLGKRVINSILKIDESLDVSKLNNGVYIIKFNDFNTTYKFVKH